jgi:hypothetical protein
MGHFRTSELGFMMSGFGGKADSEFAGWIVWK